MNLSWQPELDDLVDALNVPKPGHRRATAKRQSLLRGVLAILVLSTLGFLLTQRYEEAFSIILVLVYLVAFLGYLTVHGRRRSARTTSVAGKAWRKYDALRLPKEATISDGGVKISSAADATSLSVGWSQIRWVVETDRSFVLAVRPRAWVGDNLYSKLNFLLGVTARMPLPKRALPDPDEIAQLRTLLIEYTGERHSVAPAIAGRISFPRDQSM